MIEIINEAKEDEWKKFLDGCDAASIYHTPEWKKILEETFNYKAHYLFVEDDSGKIIGLLPLFHVKSKLTGRRLCSVPFSHVCGPIGDEDAVNFLIGEGVNLYEDLNVNHLEIRDRIDFEGFQRQSSFSTHVLELSNQPESIFNNLKTDVRRGVRRSIKKGVSVSETKNIRDLEEFYEINCITKKEIGVPCHPWKFFKNLFRFLADDVYLYIARYEGEIIAGGIMEYFKNDVLYGYGAANPDYLKLYPYNAFIWKSIEDACSNGYNHFDFGRTSYDNVGLINFKKRWGTVETKLCYSYYPKNPESLTGNRDNLKYKFGTKMIGKMPMSVYKKFSDMVFGSFG